MSSTGNQKLGSFLHTGETQERSANKRIALLAPLAQNEVEADLSYEEIDEISGVTPLGRIVYQRQKDNALVNSAGKHQTLIQLGETDDSAHVSSSEKSQISTNESNISTNSTNISSTDSKADSALENLFPNPLFSDEDGQGWSNLDETDSLGSGGPGSSEVTDSFVQYGSTVYTASAISRNDTQRTITCSGFPFSASDLDPDRYNTYIKMKGDPTTGLSGMIFKIISTSSSFNQFTIETYSTTQSFANTEKFEIGFYSERSAHCLRTNYIGSGSSVYVESDPVAIKNETQKFSLSFDWLVMGLNSSWSIQIKVAYKDQNGKTISTQSLSNYGSDPSYYRWQTDQSTISFTELTEINLTSGEEGAIISDTIYMCLRIINIDIASHGNLYVTGFQLNYGNANYLPLKNSGYASGNHKLNVNKVFGNSQAVSNIIDGRKPNGKFPSPVGFYSPLVNIDFTASSTSKRITETELLNAISSDIDLDDDDHISAVIVNIKHDNGSGWESVGHSKDVEEIYDTSTYEDEVLRQINLSSLNNSDDYRVTVACWFINTPEA